MHQGREDVLPQSKAPTPAFTLANNGDQALNNAPVWLGVPCPQGLYFLQPGIRILSDFGVMQSLAAKPCAFWPDGSVQWVKIVGTCSLQPGQQLHCYFTEAPRQDIPTHDIPVRPTQTHLHIVGTQHQQWQIERDCMLAWSCGVGASLSLHVNAEQDSVSLDNCYCEYSHISNATRPLVVEVVQRAELTLKTHKVLRLEAHSRVYLDSGDITLQLTVTNPAAANHPHGQWDLGDANSIDLQCIELLINAAHPHLLVQDKTFSSEQEAITLYQASSGKPQWQSPVHQDAMQQVTLPFQGYQVTQQGQLLCQGDHANPSVSVQPHGRKCYVTPEQFWQNFPGQVVVAPTHARISLLGADMAAPQELQPGEQKTRFIRLSSTPYHVQQQLHTRLHASWVQACKVFPFFEPAQLGSKLHNLIQQGENGENSFFTKRDRIDEYSWRHFGELYADHECALAPDVPLFVSHYNNQYDPIQGMLNQWLLTGKPRWFALADDLAKHVADIDVYHTQDDKPDYSGGLFWHTDHYVQAHTATHRTYSKHQPRGVYDGHAGGGGPGGQHCYTTGLLWHYWLTGYQPSKDALLSIADWITRYYEGDGTLLAVLMGLKNRHDPGLKNIISGRYPLDRGTGNYLQTLMDRYHLLQQQTDLDQCAQVIYNCISPDEDLKTRDFDNIEATWFYTVLLQAVCRFILLKERLQQNDATYAYAVTSLRHYARWMSRHEQNALDHADRLEFPNQTWTAQDLRKVCVLNFASRYLDEADAQAALNRAELILGRCEAWLSESDESNTTRVLCLMMQNAHYLGYRRAPQPMSIKREYPAHESLTRQTLASVVWKAMRGFSLRREVRQFKRRFGIKS